MPKETKTTFNIYAGDIFAWGLIRKAFLMGEREITYRELKDFKSKVISAITKNGYNCCVYDWGDYVDEFLYYNQNYITYDDNGIKLNDEITYEKALDVFHIGSLSLDLLLVLCQDENIWKATIKEEQKQEECLTSI